jgi:hypothetical protein
MSDWVAGLFGVGGTLVGGVLTYVTTSKADKTRITIEENRRTEDAARERARIDDERLALRQQRERDLERDALLRVQDVLKRLLHSSKTIYLAEQHFKVQHDWTTTSEYAGVVFEQSMLRGELVGLTGRLSNYDLQELLVTLVELIGSVDLSNPSTTLNSQIETEVAKVQRRIGQAIKALA